MEQGFKGDLLSILVRAFLEMTLPLGKQDLWVLFFFDALARLTPIHIPPPFLKPGFMNDNFGHNSVDLQRINKNLKWGFISSIRTNRRSSYSYLESRSNNKTAYNKGAM